VVEPRTDVITARAALVPAIESMTMGECCFLTVRSEPPVRLGSNGSERVSGVYTVYFIVKATEGEGFRCIASERVLKRVKGLDKLSALLECIDATLKHSTTWNAVVRKVNGGEMERIYRTLRH